MEKHARLHHDQLPYYLQVIARTNIPLLNRIIFAGAADLPDHGQTKVVTVNFLAAVTGAMVFAFGLFFYTKMPVLRLLIPVILEGTAFWSLILLNKFKRHSQANIGLFTIHFFSGIYFGAVLSEGLPIEFVYAFLLVYLIGASFFLYRRTKSRLYCLISTALLLVIVYANHFYGWIEPVHFTDADRIIVKICSSLGMVVILSIVCFSFISVSDKYIEEKEKLVAELKQAVEYKNKFLWLLSHEIRTPLQAVIGNADMLYLERMQYPENTRARIEDLYIASDHAKDIVNNVLDNAKREAGAFYELKKTSVDLRSLVELSISMNRIIANKRKLQIKLHFDDELTRVEADGTVITRIITNLLSNATKFAPENTSVHLLIFKKGSLIFFHIVNDGSISKEKVNSVFKPFVAERSKIEGTGLGLPITKEFVELHGGRIKLTCKRNPDDNQDKTMFSFFIPYDPAKKPTQKRLMDMEQFRFNGKILVFEDDSMNKTLLNQHIKRMGGDAICFDKVNDLPHAIQIIRDTQPDIIITDFYVPGLDVHDLLQSIDIGNTPVIIISGDQQRLHELKDEVKVCLLKPIYYSDFAMAVKACLLTENGKHIGIA